MSTELQVFLRTSQGSDLNALKNLNYSQNQYINSKDKHGNTPLHIAAELGYENICQWLLDNGADPLTKNNADCTPLHMAARYNQPAVATLLLQHCQTTYKTEKRSIENLREAKNSFGGTALHVAAQFGHSEITQTLLDWNANCKAITNDGHTPLHVAVDNNKKDIITAFLEKQGNSHAKSQLLDIPDNDGNTALHHAGCYANEETVKLLINQGADCQITNAKKETPAQCAKNNKKNTIASLIEKLSSTKNLNSKPQATSSYFSSASSLIPSCLKFPFSSAHRPINNNIDNDGKRPLLKSY